jgi:hypothetical protein
MSLFARKRVSDVQSFMLKLVNNNCAELESLVEGPRLEGRVRLTIVVLVIPLVKGKLVYERMFPAVTKEFSTHGVSIVVNQSRAFEEAVLGFRWERSMKFAKGKAKHFDPMGCGFFHLGLQLTGIVHPDEYPGLDEISF